MSTLAVTFWRSLLEPHGRLVRCSWDELAARLSRPAPCPVDVDHPDLGGWAPVELRGDYRQKENVIAVHALALDFDKHVPTVERILDGCGRRRLLLHSTRRYSPEAPRYRVVLGVSRPMRASEYDDVWHYVKARLAGRGLLVDGAPKDGSRFWYLPSEPREGGYVFRALDGEPVDVGAVLAAVARERSRQRAAVRTTTTTMGSGSRYARAALEHACDAVASAGKGMRNNRLNQAAYALARFVSTGDLGELEVRTALASAAKLAGLAGSEVTKTIASGLRGGKTS